MRLQGPKYCGSQEGEGSRLHNGENFSQILRVTVRRSCTVCKSPALPRTIPPADRLCNNCVWQLQENYFEVYQLTTDICNLAPRFQIEPVEAYDHCQVLHCEDQKSSHSDQHDLDQAWSWSLYQAHSTQSLNGKMLVQKEMWLLDQNQRCLNSGGHQLQRALAQQRRDRHQIDSCASCLWVWVRLPLLPEESTTWMVWCHGVMVFSAMVTCMVSDIGLRSSPDFARAWSAATLLFAKAWSAAAWILIFFSVSSTRRILAHKSVSTAFNLKKQRFKASGRELSCPACTWKPASSLSQGFCCCCGISISCSPVVAA